METKNKNRKEFLLFRNLRDKKEYNVTPTVENFSLFYNNLLDNWERRKRKRKGLLQKIVKRKKVNKF